MVGSLLAHRSQMMLESYQSDYYLQMGSNVVSSSNTKELADAAQDAMLLAVQVDANKIIGQRPQGSIWQCPFEAVVRKPLHSSQSKTCQGWCRYACNPSTHHLLIRRRQHLLATGLHLRHRADAHPAIACF